jgi:hypothetical protein
VSQSSRGPRGTTFALLSEVVGEKHAIALSAAFGGRRLYFPRQPQQGSKLVRVIGMRAACALGRRYGGTSVDVPNEIGVAAKVLQLRAKGVSMPKIAQKLSRTERYVRLVTAAGLAAPALYKIGPDALQAELFVLD